MPKSSELPILSAPDFRETTSAQTWTQSFRGDLNEIKKQIPLLVQTKAKELLADQIAKGNTKQYTAVVDGSKSKDIDEAQRRVVVYFVSAVLTRSLGRAKDVLRRAILKVYHRKTGVLADEWTWYYQQGGKRGALQHLGDDLPGNMTLKPGDALLLVPRAGYAWFANYYALHGHKGTRIQGRTFTKSKARTRYRRGGKVWNKPNAEAKALGFMGYSARALRSELKRVGFTVVASWTERAPPGPSGHWGSRYLPILVFKPMRGLRATPG